VLSFDVGCVPALMWFIFWKVWIRRQVLWRASLLWLWVNSRIMVRCLPNSIVAPLHLSSTSMGISLGSSADPFFFFSDRSFHFERDRICQRVQLIYLHSSLSFLVPACPRSLSITSLDADGTHCFLETSVAKDGTLANTNSTFSSASQDESASGAGAGVAQDITDAREVSSVLPSSTTTKIMMPTTTTETISTPTPTTTTGTVSDFNPQEGPPPIHRRRRHGEIKYVGGGLYQRVPSLGQRGEEDVETEGGVVGVGVGVDVCGMSA
jgi:hypothetical protein